jgi:uncharacterized membrane protein
MKTVMGLFESEKQAENAISSLREQGFSEEISLLAADSGKNGSRNSKSGNGSKGIATGVGAGGVLGGITGLAMGAGALVIPGIGPMLAMGPIAGLLSGAATGGIAGGLINWGIPTNRGNYYESKIKEGKIMTAVRSKEEKVDKAAKIMREKGAFDVEAHLQ